MGLAIIESGFYDLSEQVTVLVDEAPNGTNVLLYDDVAKEEGLLGQSTTTLGKATITLATPLEAGQRIIAYVGAFGEKTYGAVNVAEGILERTGWKVPATVDGVPYDEYLAEGNAPIASTYDPDGCYNRAQAYETDIESLVHQKNLSFVVEIQNTAVAGVPTAIAVVKEVIDAPNGVLYSFDGATPDNANSKSYTANGTYSVQVTDVADADNTAEVSFDVSLLAAPTPPTSAIDLVYFDPQNTPQGPVLLLWAKADLEVEFSVDGISSFASIPPGEQSGGWVKAQTYRPGFWSRGLILPGTGNYTARVRIKTDTADQKVFDVYV
ncbi:hypothetical protein [Salmonirosea aquatica]|uniref:Uncharacterized protein n=1 Tax=Salmonirosea aquatica TaxID=2654236 RepID=A0A7C9BI93_9BACT|nr:hypothetical protein [Cytophagaceae bacterium SJW1-29]